MSVEASLPSDNLEIGWNGMLPAGTYTFLTFTISGLAQEFQRNGKPLNRHGSIQRIAEVCATHGIIVRSSQQPRLQVVIAFSSVWNAIEAISKYYELEDVDLLSMGVSAGITFGESPDACFPLLKAAALADLALPGQVLISASTFELIRDGAPYEWEFEDLGTIHLNFQVRRERIFQILHPSLPSIRAFLQTEERIRPPLPHRFGLLIGREEFVEKCHGPLARFPIVTLTGPAGIGKSHIASRLANQLQSQGDEVVWVNLTGVEREEPFYDRLAESLGLRGRQFPLKQLILRQLSGRRIRFILDGCDRCLDVANAFVDEATKSVGPSFLVTSPRRLGLSEEKEVAIVVPPLPTPSLKVLWTPDDLEEHESTSLFMDRARETNQRFSIDDVEANAVARLCAHLSGHPLSILLAANRVNQLAPSQILLDLKAIEGIPKKRPSSTLQKNRHGSLHEALEWTFECLSPSAKSILLAIVPLRGRWDTHIAATLADLDTDEIKAPLSELVEAGLIDIDQVLYDGNLYRLPLAVAQMATSRFGSAEAKAASYEQHSFAMISILAQTAQMLGEDGELEALNRFDEHKDDVFAALEYNLRPDGHLSTFTEALVRSWSYWYMRNHISDALRLIDIAVQRHGKKPSSDLARVLSLGGALATKAGMVDKAQVYLRKAIKIDKDTEERKISFAALGNQGMLFWSIGQYQKALASFDESIPLIPDSLAPSARTNLYASWFTALLDAGDIIKAEEVHAAARKSQEDMGNHQQNWMLSVGEGQLWLRKGDVENAQEKFICSALTALEVKDLASLARSTYWLAECEYIKGRIALASQFLGFTQTASQASGIKLYPINEVRINNLTLKCENHLGAVAFRQSIISGSLMSLVDLLAQIEK